MKTVRLDLKSASSSSVGISSFVKYKGVSTVILYLQSLQMTRRVRCPVMPTYVHDQIIPVIHTAQRSTSLALPSELLRRQVSKLSFAHQE